MSMATKSLFMKSIFQPTGRRCFSMLAMQRTFMPVSLLRMQVRYVHSRGYNKVGDTWIHLHSEADAAILNAYNTKDIAWVFTQYKDVLTPEIMSAGLIRIAYYKLDRSPEFWEVILPTIKDFLANADRQTVKALADMIKSFGDM